MDHSLINPNQIRAYGIPLWDNAYDTSKNSELSIELDEAVKVQMKTEGTKILFECRAPTKQELQECTKIHLTSKKEWNPHQVRMSEGMVSLVSATRPNDLDENLLESLDPSLLELKEKLAALVPRYIAEMARCDDSLEDIPTRQTSTSTERHVKMSAEVLADIALVLDLKEQGRL